MKMHVSSSSRGPTRSLELPNSGCTPKGRLRLSIPSTCPVQSRSCYSVNFTPTAPTTTLIFPPAGESVFYNSNILHCAAYDCKARRATLHATMGNVAGGSVRARNILQHGLSWMKEPQFSDGLDARGKVMLGRLLDLYNAVGDADVGYSLSS